MSGDNGIPIAIVPKNHREQVQVSLSNFEGHDLINVRVFYDDGTEFRPTKKGIALNITRLPELIDALKEADAEARRRGLLR